MPHIVNTIKLLRTIVCSAVLLSLLSISPDLSLQAHAQPADRADTKSPVSAQKAATTKAPALFEFRIAQDEKAQGFTQRPSSQEKALFVSDEIGLSIADIPSALPSVDSQSKQTIALKLTLTPQGAQKLERLTAAHVGKKLATIIRGQVHQAPVIQEKIGGGRLLMFLKTSEETKALLKELKAQIKSPK